MDINVKEKDQQEVVISDLNEPLNFTINDGASLTLKFALFNNLNNSMITGKIKKNAKLNVVYADFAKGEGKVVAKINLDEEGANANWNLASLATKDDHKEFDVSFIHNAKNTKADMQNYGVALNKSRLVFSGTNHIIKDAKKSNTNQSAKIIVFDKEASGKANPILRIDENDVLASHAAIVGRLNDEHLFYLKSRGLSEDEAKTLIVYGYLKPIANSFNEAMQEKMNNMIQERCHV